MKTLNSKAICSAILILLSVSFTKAQTPVHCCTVIDVTDGYYSDKVWMITEPGTTDGFDNGWDGYKFLSSATYIPQIYDNTTDGKFQVSSFPTIENNFFAFMPGTSTDYTMTFTHYDISYFYPGLFLVDLVSGDTVDIYANLSTYKFKASKADMVDRFKFISKLPVVVPPPVVVVGADEEVNADSGTEPVDKEIVVDNLNDKKGNSNKATKVIVAAYKKKLSITNNNKVKAIIRVIDARNGILNKQICVGAKSKKVVDLKAKSGNYVIQTLVGSDYTSTTILIQ